MVVITLTPLGYPLHSCVSDVHVWLPPQAQDDDRHGDHTATNTKATVSLLLRCEVLLLILHFQLLFTDVCQVSCMQQ